MERKPVLAATLMLMLVSVVGLTALSSFSARVEAQFEQWLPFVPGSYRVTLQYKRISGISYINIAIAFESTAYNISDWGTPTSTGSAITADGKAWFWTGASIPVLVTWRHSYNLGKLPPGDYVFTFATWGVPVRSIAFTVSPYQIVVPDDYSRIQWAIGNATDGDSIFVKAGTYVENVTVNKPVSLIGESQSTTIVDGNMAFRCIDIRANNVIIRGFTVQNSFMGIFLFESSYCVLSSNSMSNIGYGIMLHKSSMNMLLFNMVCNNTIGLIISTDSSYNTVERNIFRNNTNSGIDFDQSSYNIISSNEISANGRGISLVGSTTIGNKIVNNTISNNGGAIPPDGGIVLIDWPHDNMIYRNNFLYNTHHASISGSDVNAWDNGFDGNFWSNYAGVDNSNPPDGIGENPYAIDANNQDNYPLMNHYWNLGDINHDLTVDIKDLSTAAGAYGALLNDEKWNPHADLTGPEYLPDGKVDIRDLALIATYYGQTYP